MLPNGQKRWLTLYRDALLELDLQKMPERIVLACSALQERSRELQGSGGHYGEKLEIEYALRNLHVAERMK
jgi:gluconate kinase